MRYRILEHYDGSKIYYTIQERKYFIWWDVIDYTKSGYNDFPLTFYSASAAKEFLQKYIISPYKRPYTKVIKEI